MVLRPSGSNLALPVVVSLTFKGAEVAGIVKALPATLTFRAGAGGSKLEIKALNVGGSGSAATLTIKVRVQKGAMDKATVTFVQ